MCVRVCVMCVSVVCLCVCGVCVCAHVCTKVTHSDVPSDVFHGSVGRLILTPSVEE